MYVPATLETITNVLEMYRCRPGTELLFREELDLNLLLPDWVESGRWLACERKTVIQVQINSHLPTLKASHQCLRRLIMNLLENAIKAAPEAGLITVVAWSLQDTITIDVTDTGCLEQQEVERMFAKFRQVERTKRKYIPGYGLGLQTCQKIVEAHHGRISCRSEAGKGTTFQVVIPLNN